MILRLVAEINSQAEMAILQLKNDMTLQDRLIQEANKPEEYSQADKDKLMEEMRQFDAKLKLEQDKLSFEKDKAAKDQELKLRQINSKPKQS